MRQIFCGLTRVILLAGLLAAVGVASRSALAGAKEPDLPKPPPGARVAPDAQERWDDAEKKAAAAYQAMVEDLRAGGDPEKIGAKYAPSGSDAPRLGALLKETPPDAEVFGADRQGAGTVLLKTRGTAGGGNGPAPMVFGEIRMTREDHAWKIQSSDWVDASYLKRGR